MIAGKYFYLFFKTFKRLKYTKPPQVFLLSYLGTENKIFPPGTQTEGKQHLTMEAEPGAMCSEARLPKLDEASPEARERQGGNWNMALPTP